MQCVQPNVCYARKPSKTSTRAHLKISGDICSGVPHYLMCTKHFYIGNGNISDSLKELITMTSVHMSVSISNLQ